MNLPIYHSISLEKLYKELKTHEKGLTAEEAKKRLQQGGKNKLSNTGKRVTTLDIFIDQWKSPLLIILLIAGIVSGVLREWIDMGVILFTAFINALVGFFQENKANKALAELERLVQFSTIVFRDGEKKRIRSEDLVLGDIVLLSAGDKIPADGRIIDHKELLVTEAALTGESEPVKKKTGTVSESASVGDRKNMVFCGTTVVNGHGMMVVTGTGEMTELGKIAALVSETADEKTPLQAQLGILSKQLSWLILIIAFLIFTIGSFVIKVDGHTIFDMFELAVAVAVAAIPEGLVISLTITLAIAMRQILNRRALVRKLLAAETLGSVSVICTDKTGTITKGEMQVTRIITDLDDLNYEEIQLLHRDKTTQHQDALTALHFGAVCNEATVVETEDGEVVTGDTTDIAFIHAAKKAGYVKKVFDQVYRNLDEIPFDSRAKYMAQYTRIDHTCLLSVKGAPEVVMERCAFIERQGEKKKIGKKERERFMGLVDELTSKGLRVIAVAYKDTANELKKISDKDIDSLVFVALVALSDPLRSDAKATIDAAAKAGIRTIILTGDHRKTACAIAAGVGIATDEETVIDGSSLGAMDDTALSAVIDRARVFARLDPAQKIRIVQLLQKQGHVVSMTGDGVNDAPALRAADIGIALGSGTDVAKETSDIILLDDSLSTIVTTIEEGRTIYQNIKKILLYLLSNSFTEVIIILASIFTGNPIAMIPVQILWVNIIQDSIPTIALAFDRGDKENMHEPPRDRNAPLIDGEMKVMIILKSVLSNIALFGIFLYFWNTTQDIALTRTIVFVGLAIDALFYIFSIRSLRRMIWRINIWNNPYVLISVVFGWIMLLAAIYVPALQYILETVPLSVNHWMVLLTFGMSNLVFFEIIKWLYTTRSVK